MATIEIVTYEDMLDAIVPRLQKEPPARAFMDTLANVVDYLDRRLLDLQSDLIVERHEKEVTAEKNFTSLPGSFLGLRMNPVLHSASGGKITLYPLPEELENALPLSGSPQYYELFKNRLYVYPAPTSTTTLKFSSYQRTEVVCMQQETPYGHLFDDQIMELIVKFGADPMMVVSPYIDAFLDQAVDRVVHRRTTKHIHWQYPQ